MSSSCTRSMDVMHINYSSVINALTLTEKNIEKRSNEDFKEDEEAFLTVEQALNYDDERKKIFWV